MKEGARRVRQGENTPKPLFRSTTTATRTTTAAATSRTTRDTGAADREPGVRMEEVDESPFRARSNTWPLPRPDLQDEVYGASPSSEENEASDQIHLLSANGNHLLLSPESGDTVIPTTAHEVNLNKSQQLQSLVNGQQQLKKNTSRRNAWGNMSYADLITQAIQGSPDKRLTLSQIYEWMVQNVPYFKDKGDSNSSAGWKVSPQS